MPSFPTVTSGSMTVTRSSRLPVRVLAFADSSEQRFRISRQLESFTVNFTALSAADAAILRTFYEGRKGTFDTFDFTFQGVTYSNCSFDSAEFRSTEAQLSQLTLSLKFSQRK